MVFPAFLDACVLVPMGQTDTLLRLADAETYRPLWSEQVLAEVERNLSKVSPVVTPARARRRVDAMRSEFPDALVTGYDDLIPNMTNDPKDRHVLAAAVRAGAPLIVTANLRDFPADALRPYDINVVSPDDFLLNQLDLDPAVVLQCVREQIAACIKPAMCTTEFVANFARTLPKFAEAIGVHLAKE